MHNKITYRKQPSGRAFETKINFYPCYIQINKEIRELLKRYKANSKASWRQTSLNLCKKPRMIDSTKTKISMAALSKLCSIYSLNIWSTINNAKIYGKTSGTSIMIPSKEAQEDLDY